MSEKNELSGFVLLIYLMPLLLITFICFKSSEHFIKYWAQVTIPLWLMSIFIMMVILVGLLFATFSLLTLYEIIKIIVNR